MDAHKVQGSDAWLNFRLNKIGSSSAAAIMRMNPFCSRLRAYNQIKGLETVEETAPMRRGKELEESARQWYGMVTGKKFIPDVIEYNLNPLIFCSLDGISEDGEIIEIKCSDKVVEKARNDFIDPYCWVQCQHQMLVTHKLSCTFIAFDGFEGIIKIVQRDQEFIEKMLQEEVKFLHLIKTNTPPTDYEHIDIDENQAELVAKWKMASEKIKYWEQVEKQLRFQIVDLVEDKDIEVKHQGYSILRIKKITRNGSIDWEKLCFDKNISDKEINEYRKEGSIYYKIESTR